MIKGNHSNFCSPPSTLSKGRRRAFPQALDSAYDSLFTCREALAMSAGNSAQRREDFPAPEIDDFWNIWSEWNAKRNLRKFIASRQ